MTPRRRDLLLITAGGVAAAAAGMALGPLIVQGSSGVPELLSAKLSDVTGAPRSVSEWTDRIIVCNFWATWCAPCVEEIPLLLAARSRYRSRGVEVLGIAIDQPDKVAQFAEQNRISYPVLLAQGNGIGLLKKLGNGPGGLPYTVVLDKDRAIVHRKLGAFKEKELDSLLASAVA